MVSKLETFVARIDNFEEINSSSKIIYFSYFILNELQVEFFTVDKLKECYTLLNLVPYSKINFYLTQNSKGKNKSFIKFKGGFKLERNAIDKISQKLGDVKHKPSSAYFSADLLADTRGYIVKTGNQASLCYDLSLFDACLVMTRKLIETLVIEAFERHNISEKIKSHTGQFFYLSDLIDILLKENSFNISRNSQQGLPKIKKYADMSAHNRRFNAAKIDIDSFKDELRILIEELVHLIDYPSWNTSK